MNNEIYLYDQKYCGEHRLAKLNKIRAKMGQCDHLIISTLEDIAWLFNIRGSDLDCTPVGYAYAVIDKRKATLYVQANTISAKDRQTLINQDIAVKDYQAIYNDVGNFFGQAMVDFNTINYALLKAINYSCKLVNAVCPVQALKAIKNEIEIAATKNAHLKDGVAVTKFMYWLKHHQDLTTESEITVADKLTAFRAQQKLFTGLSFDTICAYQANGALMHYKATTKSAATLANKGLLLIDSGGQYLDGTTDITRTFVLGDITPLQKHDFTVALKSMLRLQKTSFLEGTTGPNLDILARGVVYDYGINYRCGTGHGVGHFLGVHEGPQNISQRNRTNYNVAIVPGMITTDEPGIYREGEHGIRHENELLCVKDHQNEYGDFYSFLPLTLVPFDSDGIDFSLLSNSELKELNKYHQNVYQKVAPFLTEDEAKWLEKVCAEH